jgi:rhodanese-related sulfurtransferase
MSENPAGAALALAKIRAVEAGLGYAGDVAPADAGELARRGEAVIVDVRSAEELKFVGRIPGALHVPWATGMALASNPDFLTGLDRAAPREQAVLFLCRSARRSVSAAKAATAAGWSRAFNILEGFEGEKDERMQRGNVDGWRKRGLPWEQD